LFAPPRNAVAFLTSFSVRKKYCAGNFAVCGRRPWALPLDPTSIFEKLLDQKTFIDLVSKSLRKQLLSFKFDG
jgi:hypothetical protein